MTHTRVRMSKEAAKLIHEHRDTGGFSNNTDSVNAIFRGRDCLSGQCKRLQGRIDSKNQHIKFLDEKIDSKKGLIDKLHGDKNALQMINHSHWKQLSSLKSKVMNYRARSFLFGLLAFIGWALFAALLFDVMVLA